MAKSKAKTENVGIANILKRELLKTSVVLCALNLKVKNMEGN